MDVEHKVVDLEGIINARGRRYGVFLKHAEVSQHLKNVIFGYISKDALEDDQVEALEMICHKLGRIINGDPNYSDSWIDIAGYARLVADRLEGVNR